MPLRRLSIQWKITLLAGLCLLAIVALLVTTSLAQARRSAALVNQANTEMLDSSARLRLQAHAETQALRIQRYFMDAYQYGNGFARLVQVLKARGGNDLRADLPIGRNLSLYGRIDNVFDRQHIGSVIVNEGNGRYYEPGPGRAVLLGLEWQLR